MRVRGTPPFDRGTTTKNIEAILKLEEDDERKLSSLHRVSHKVGWFVGTIYFVIIQAVFVLLWLFWNAFAVWPFDPYPFPLLSAVLALEAVFLTSFVLIRQNSMDRQSERRNHLDLQINLLAEKEATSILRALSEIAKHLQIDLSTYAESRELTEDTAVGEHSPRPAVQRERGFTGGLVGIAPLAGQARLAGRARLQRFPEVMERSFLDERSAGLNGRGPILRESTKGKP